MFSINKIKLLLLILGVNLFAYTSFSQEVVDELIEEAVREKMQAMTVTTSYPSGSRSDFSEKKAEPFMAINKSDTAKVGIIFIGEEARTPLFLSDDGGETWIQSTLDTREIVESLYPSHNVFVGVDPVFTFAPDNSIHVCWLSLHGTNPEIFENEFECMYAVSHDFGETWEIKPSLYSGILNTGDVLDRIWMDSDHSGGDFHGNVYLNGAHFVESETAPRGQVVFTKPEGADEFNPVAAGAILPGEIIPEEYIAATQKANIQVDNFGYIHVSAGLTEQFSTDDYVVYSRSTDGGETYEPQKIVGEGGKIFKLPEDEIILHGRESGTPSLAVDNNKVYLAWSDFSSGTARSYYAYSHDNGLTFSDQIEFNSELNGDTHGSILPSVAADDNRMALSWYYFDWETRETVYLSAYSTDAGLSLSGFDTLSMGSTFFGELWETNFFGDYNDADMIGCLAHFTWTDGRTGEAIVYHSTINTCEDGQLSLAKHTPVTDRLKIGDPYPNPVQDNFSLKIHTSEMIEVCLQLFDLSGKKLGEKRIDIHGEQVIEWDVSDLSGGSYVLIGSTGNYFFTRNWIKQY